MLEVAGWQIWLNHLNGQWSARIFYFENVLAPKTCSLISKRSWLSANCPQRTAPPFQAIWYKNQWLKFRPEQYEAKCFYQSAAADSVLAGTDRGRFRYSGILGEAFRGGWRWGQLFWWGFSVRCWKCLLLREIWRRERVDLALCPRFWYSAVQ
jgi:hypothetical protein